MTETKIDQQYEKVYAQIKAYYAAKMRQAREERQAITWVELIEARNRYLAWAHAQHDAQLARVEASQCQ